MAGDWIKWNKGLTRKREILSMSARMKMSPAHIAGLCMIFWEWLDDNVSAPQIDEDGNAVVTLGALQPEFLDALVAASGFAAAMTAEGWLNARSGSLTVPNYSRNNGQTAKDRALTSERVSKSRRKNSPKCNGSTVTGVTVPPLPEKRREDKRREECVLHPPPPQINKLDEKPDDWLARLTLEWPGLNVRRELAKALRKNPDGGRVWFETRWLPFCEKKITLPDERQGGDRPDPEPDGWRATLEAEFPGNLINAEKRPWADVPSEIRTKLWPKWPQQ